MKKLDWKITKTKSHLDYFAQATDSEILNMLQELIAVYSREVFPSVDWYWDSINFYICGFEGRVQIGEMDSTKKLYGSQATCCIQTIHFEGVYEDIWKLENEGKIEMMEAVKRCEEYDQKIIDRILLEAKKVNFPKLLGLEEVHLKFFDYEDLISETMLKQSDCET